MNLNDNESHHNRLSGLKSFNEVINILNNNGIHDVNIATDSLNNKFNLIDIVNINNNQHPIGHSILIVKFNDHSYYYMDPTGSVSKSVLNKFIPINSHILISMDQMQPLQSQDCTSYVMRDAILLHSNKLSLNNFIVLHMIDVDQFEISYKSIPTVNKNKLNHITSVEDQLING